MAKATYLQVWFWSVTIDTSSCNLWHHTFHPFMIKSPFTHCCNPFAQNPCACCVFKLENFTGQHAMFVGVFPVVCKMPLPVRCWFIKPITYSCKYHPHNTAIGSFRSFHLNMAHTWRTISLSKWFMTLVSKFPKWIITSINGIYIMGCNSLLRCKTTSSHFKSGYKLSRGWCCNNHFTNRFPSGKMLFYTSTECVKNSAKWPHAVRGCLRASSRGYVGYVRFQGETLHYSKHLQSINISNYLLWFMNQQTYLGGAPPWTHHDTGWGLKKIAFSCRT